MINKIFLKNFRNFSDIELTFKKPFVYLYGENGSGKTSVLESIYFCATTKSHRSSDEEEMIKKEMPFSSIKIFTNENKFEIVLSKHGKRLFIDNVEKRKISSFFGKLRVVMFSPEDLALIKGAPSIRRQFMDLEWMQLKKNYLNDLNTYKRVLKQRNSLLKNLSIGDDLTFLNILGDQLYEVGKKIIEEREIFLNEINELFVSNYKLFSDHEVKFVYKPNVTENEFKKYLNENQKQDILYQATNAGPHRDDFYIEFENNDAKSYASQGEQRLIVIALKLTIAQLIEKLTNQKAILLLDDVLSELDENKQKIFLENIPLDNQVIMNSTQKIEGIDAEIIKIEKEQLYV